MNRPEHENVNFFVGTEVERTPAFGKRTLFVVGWQPVLEIVRLLAEHNSYTDNTKHIEHIFFGANHSFHPANRLEWQRWESMIEPFLGEGTCVVWTFLSLTWKSSTMAHCVITATLFHRFE
jgi:hypothetical protein